MKSNNFKHLTLSLVTIAMLSACGSSSTKSNTVADDPVAEPATQSNPPSTTQETPTTGDEEVESVSEIPSSLAKPIVSNVPESTTEDEVIVELTGEAGATVWINDQEITVIDSDGTVEITLDTSGESGSKTFTIVLKNDQGQTSEALVILVEKEEATPTNSTISNGSTTTYNPPATVVEKEGTLIDSTVVGVDYNCGSKVGKTDENGLFSCSVFPVIFSVGNVEIGRIGAITPDSKVFVQDLVGVPRDNFTDPMVLKIAKFLQSMDDDGDYNTSIKIDGGAIALPEPKKLSDLNDTALQQLFADGGITPVSDDAVIAHLIANAHEDVNKTLALDKYAVFVDKEDLNISDGINIMSDLTLPTIGSKGSSYSYASSDEASLSVTGVVHRQSFVEGNKSVTMTATISKNSVSDTKLFSFNVVALPITDLESVTLAKEDLNISATLNAIDGNIALATDGLYDTTITWISSNSAIISTTGVVTRPSFSDGNQVVELTATISKGAESVTKVFELTVLKLAISDAEIVANVKNALDLGDTSALTSNLTLPTEIDGVSITWSSSSDAISSTGVINPNNYTGTTKTATLTATLTKGAITETKEFEITVPPLPMSDAEAVALEKNGLGIGLVGDELLEITGDITLPLYVYDNGVAIYWESNNTSIISNSGEVHRPSYSMGSTGVKLTATLTKGSVTDTKEFIVFVKPLDMTKDEMIADAYTRLTFDDIKGENSDENHIVSNLVLPSNLIVDNGSNVFIKWESNNSTIIATNGAITPPSFTTGDQSVRLTATIGISDGAGGFDSAYTTVSKSFDLVVKALAMTDAEAVAMEKRDLTLGDISHITTNIRLPLWVHDNGVAISWESNNSSIISNDGTVNRPSFLTGDITVTLTATLSRGSAVDTKSFVATVIKNPQIVADLTNLAVDIELRELNTTTYSGFIFELRTDGATPTETGQNALAVYGKTNVTGDDYITLYVHEGYEVGTHFQVIVKDSYGNIVGKSGLVSFADGADNVDYGVINIDIGEDGE